MDYWTQPTDKDLCISTTIDYSNFSQHRIKKKQPTNHTPPWTFVYKRKQRDKNFISRTKENGYLHN